MTDSAEIAKQIASLIGGDRVRTPHGAEARAAAVIAQPADAAEIVELVRKCEADSISIAPLGAARTLSEIRRAPAALGVSLSRMARVIAYEPDDMTIVAQAGISVAELNTAMAQSRQRLPVDPRDPDLSSVGAMIAAHHAGPLRLSEGTARDLLIGIQFIGHGGAMIRSGGRVVKNVAGYDFMKLMNGSFGTLGIITEAAFKVRPIPELYTLAIASFDRAGGAFDAARSFANAAPLAHLEVTSPRMSGTLGLAPAYSVLAGISGTRTEVEYLCGAIARASSAAIEFLAGDDAWRVYCALRDCDFVDWAIGAQVVVPPAALAGVLAACDAEFRAHAGSGIAQIVTREAPAPDAAPAIIASWRELARDARGHLRVLRTAPEIRGAIEFFDSPNRGALELMRALKSAFDPAGIFNPGCFVGGI